MNALKKLENLKTGKAYKGFANLDLGFHLIECFRLVKNKYKKKVEGNKKSIIVELKDEILFLPAYFLQKLSEDDINELNSSISSEGEKVYLYFEGKLGQSE